MRKEIRLNAFDMNCVGHIQHGMWTHPRDHSTEYKTIEYWQGLARLAERGKFDFFFIADTPAARTENLQAWSRSPLFMNVLEPISTSA